MAVENPQYINGFNPAWPDGLDSKSQGDDHIRNIKAAIQRTFPNITAPVTATAADLNKVSGVGVFNTPGIITMWAGTIATIPAGWKLCNGTGTISTGLPVPDLRNRFVVGAGDSYAPGATGGALTHTHVVTVADHTLTIAQIPAHSHSYVRPNNTVYLDGGGFALSVAGSVVETALAGGGQPHKHNASLDTVGHLPPYFALAYIIKD